MIEIADAEPMFYPNETHLQVATLQTRLAAMEIANGDVTVTAVPLSNSRIGRSRATEPNDR